MESTTFQLKKLGLTSDQAEKLVKQIEVDSQTLSPEEVWQKIIKSKQIDKFSFEIYLLLYKTLYPDSANLPAPAWVPEEGIKQNTHIGQLMRAKGFDQYAAFHRWSATSFSEFWQCIIQLLNIQFDHPYSAIVDLSQGVESPQWLPGAKFNIINSCFQAAGNATAILSQNEAGKATKTSYDELNRLSNRIANGLLKHFNKGDKIGIVMPMTREAVAMFLGIIKAGCIVVCIPDSFSAEEIAKRLQISNAKAVFCQDKIIRDGKSLALYDRVKNANAAMAIVLPAEAELSVSLRQVDISWKDFLSENEKFVSVTCNPHDHILILFSSGTTGDPKAIPWSQSAAIKCGSDAYLHHDLNPDDIFCWPTNLGWMMGPWLIFACLLNKATIALYEGTPNSKNFGKFIQDTHLTHLGVVPTLVKTWRSSACMENLDWTAIRLFTSTGERSNTDDMLYLMYLGNNKPVIEYCGGTEIGGSYITGTLVQPAAPAAFTTPALGLDFVIMDENGLPADTGEVALVPPSIGLSTELLNKDHHQVYYANMPQWSNQIILRRHGDQVKKYSNGFYRLLGRVDDTMKLSGIKVSSAEIETVLNLHQDVYETAAIAVNPPDNSPTQLVIYAVLKANEKISVNQLKENLQTAIKQRLNPLFKIHEVIIVDALPRTASNKIMRRILRDEYEKLKYS